LDPAVAVVESLLNEYPRVSARLIIGEIDIGTNPKVNNLVQSYEQARFDWVLISDSNVRVAPSYLKRLVAHLDSSVGMLSAAVFGAGARGLGGEMEAAFLNTFYARGMILAARVGRPCVVGKSMLFRKSVAKRFGGIRALACYLAEDYMAGEAMRALGLQVKIAHDPVVQHIGDYGVDDFWNRHLRWGRIRKSQEPLAYLAEVFGSSVLVGIMGAWSYSRLSGSGSGWLFFALHLSAWFLCDLYLTDALGGAVGVRGWLAREFSAFPLWLHALCGKTVLWRGKRLSVARGGILE
jgi:ceramide glucosyltransferase